MIHVFQNRSECNIFVVVFLEHKQIIIQKLELVSHDVDLSTLLLDVLSVLEKEPLREEFLIDGN